MTNAVDALLGAASRQRATYNAARAAGPQVTSSEPAPGAPAGPPAPRPAVEADVERTTVLLAANHIHQGTIAELRTAIANYRDNDA